MEAQLEAKESSVIRTPRSHCAKTPTGTFCHYSSECVLNTQLQTWGGGSFTIKISVWPFEPSQVVQKCESVFQISAWSHGGGALLWCPECKRARRIARERRAPARLISIRELEEREGESERALDKTMSDQLEEAERELYKHVGCKMFHSTGDAAHMLR